MILTIGNTKGGVGKTTLAVQLAIARAMSGRDVWLIDGDRQGTATAAVAARAEAGRLPGIACAQYPDGPTLRGQVQQQRGKFDDIIIDVGGRDSTALRAALVLSDVLLVPFAPRALLQRLAAVRGRLSLCADQAAAAKWWLSMPMASVSAEGPMPKALSTRRTSPLMPGCRHQGRACPLRRARMTSNPLIVA